VVQLVQLSKESLTDQAKSLFNRGIKATKELLECEKVQLDAFIELEDNLDLHYRSKLKSLDEHYSKYIAITEENHFIQGYLAAKGFQDGLIPERVKTQYTEREIVYIEDIPKGVTLVIKGTLFVGTGIVS
jgi:hypothetical protein